MIIEYSISYIKKNKIPSIFIMAAVFVATLFISTLSCLFFNIWIDDIIRNSIVDAGGLQDRSIAEMIKQELQTMQEPSTLLKFYIGIFIFACISLILIIKNAFQFSMNSRIHQLGIFQSIGATPKQLRIMLLQEAVLISLVPIICGIVLGIFLCMGIIRYMNILQSDLEIIKSKFHYHYILFIVAVVSSFLTAIISAWFPAKKLSKVSTLQAIKGEYEPSIKKMKKFNIVSAIFGIEGELSRKSLYLQRKALRIATLCLTISFLVVTISFSLLTVSEVNIKLANAQKYTSSGSETGFNYDELLETERQNAEIYGAYKKMLLAFSGLLACIGVANVFANTLGNIFQRKREFARYQSLGLTPKGFRKIFLVEFLIIGVKPILISIPFNVLFILYAVNATRVTIKDYFSEMPILTIILFTFIILASVGISYFIGWKQMKKINIVDDLKNDTLL